MVESSTASERGEFIMVNSMTAGSMTEAQTPPSGPPISHIGTASDPNRAALANRDRHPRILRARPISWGWGRFIGAKISSSTPCVSA